MGLKPPFTGLWRAAGSAFLALRSGLTLLTALSLWWFGGEVLNGFSFALVMGILVGTYSSVYIASPILIFFQNFVDARKQDAKRKNAA